MVPALLNFVIMGLLWMREDDVIIRLITDTLIINFYSLIISIKIMPVLLEIRELIAAPFIILIKRARKC